MGPGDVVAERFALDREAGAGAMGCVYRADDRRTGGVVALKVMLGVQHADRFAREAVALASLRHEAIVGYIDHGVTADGTAWLAMEWLDGEDLADRLTRGRLTVAEARALVLRVAAALDAAHRIGIVHRDIKPSNVFLPGRSLAAAKVVDFGIARMASGSQTLTRPGAVLGTPSYMAPEQARGATDVGPAADVFALGGLLYECVVGVPAFRGEHAMAVLAKILFEDAPRASAADAAIPRALDDLIARMLAKDPAMRPADASAVLEELARLDLEATAGAPTKSTPGALGGDEQRYVAALLVVGAAAASGDATTLADSDALPLPPLVDIVARHGGRAEVLADGTLAVLVAGAGGAATDQAARAARCALALRQVLPEEPMLLAMGRADLGTARSVGDVIDRAAALGRGARRGGAVRLDEVAAGLLEVGFEIHRGSDAIELRREHEAIESTRTLLGRPTPCVGRERELALLASYVDECLAEPCARAVVVTAVAGVGKSRLAHEAVRRLRQRDEAIAIWITRADATRAGSPFGLLAPLIRQLAGTHEGEPLALRQEKLRELLARRLERDALEHATVFLAELVGAPFPAGISRLLDDARPDAKRLNEHVRHAWCVWLAAECATQPLAIVVEDLHWGDAPSASFLDSALRELRELPFFVLALARPEVSERFPRLWVERGAQEVRLAALGKRPCEALVREVLGARATAETVERVVRQAAGNAFFLEELIRAVAEDRAESLPETVVAMAAARLERLSPEARLLLRAASVFGEVFWAGGVAALASGLAAARVEELLPDLVAAEVIVQRGDGRFAGETEYAFRHALMREAAHAMLTDEDRVLGHRLAGCWLEAAGETQAIVVAEHFDVGGEAALAHAWYVRAATQALEANQFRSVLAHATRALELDAEASATEIHELRGDAYFALGASADAVRELTAALERVPPSDRDHHVRIRLRIANASFMAFDLDGLRAQGEAALSLLGLDDRPALIAEAMAAVAVADQALGELEAAVRDYPRIKERAGGHYFANEAPLLNAFLWHGDHDELIARGSAYVDAARAQHDVQGMLLVQPAMGLALVGKGRYRDALRLFDEARAGAARFGNNPMLARTNSMATSMYLEAFDFEQAAHLAREARERALTFSFPATTASACIDLLLIAIRGGDIAAAETQLVETSERVATLEGKGWHGWLFAMRLTHARAELALARGQIEAALGHAIDALAQARHHSRLKYLAIAETTRGRALIATGAREDGVVALGTAVDRARKLGDPAVLLRSALALHEHEASDPLLAELRDLVAGMAAELPDGTRDRLMQAEAVRAVIAR